MWCPRSICSSVVASLPWSFLVMRTPKISEILSPFGRYRPNSELRSKILWIGKWRLKMKLRQYSIWLIA